MDLPTTPPPVPRLVAAGVREVLGSSLPGDALHADVRALLLGTRIDTRALPAEFVEPEAMDLSGIGAAFVSATACWCCSVRPRPPSNG